MLRLLGFVSSACQFEYLCAVLAMGYRPCFWVQALGTCGAPVALEMLARGEETQLWCHVNRISGVRSTIDALGAVRNLAQLGLAWVMALWVRRPCTEWACPKGSTGCGSSSDGLRNFKPVEIVVTGCRVPDRALLPGERPAVGAY